ncbi:hypothetical protein [Sulfuriflexus mobilis]|uniref:hypothetical protein n=1 Tax=Sulfuriflexus mobilis TaxID=1811807 RepID=UPI000F8362A6|nr:hypothetical protein [Sulfuriflexus mobilis]
MNTHNEEQLKHIKSKIVKIQIIGAPGTILLGLGLYGMFGAQGNAFHPLLNDLNIVYGLLGVGATIALWQLFTLIPLWRKQSRLVKESSATT